MTPVATKSATAASTRELRRGGVVDGAGGHAGGCGGNAQRSSFIGHHGERSVLSIRLHDHASSILVDTPAVNAKKEQSMSDTAMESVFDHFHARRRGDIDAVAAGLDADVVHQGVLPELVCTGRRAVRERIRQSLAGGESGIERLEFHSAGDSVVVGIAGPRFREIPFLDGEIFMVFTVRDGHIVRIDDYRTREEAFRAVRTGAPTTD
jgi:ketosteroid isomerase-like protein